MNKTLLFSSVALPVTARGCLREVADKMTISLRAADGQTRRVEILRHYSLPDTLPQQSFERIVRLADQHFGMPIAVIALIEKNHRLLLAKRGFDAPDTDRVNSLCAHAVRQDDVFVVPDTFGDRRFRNIDIVRQDPKVRFYAGTPLKAADGRYIGTLCLMDRKPRAQLTDRQKAFLKDLASLAVDEMELRAAEKALTSEIESRTKTEHRLQAIRDQLDLFIENAPAPIAMFNHKLEYIAASRRWREDYGLVHQNIIGRSHYDVFPEIPDRWKSIHLRCLEGETLKSDRDSFRRADGSVIWLRWEIQPWYDENCTVGGIIMFNEIITDRIRAAVELERNQRFLSTVLESVEEGIVACDSEGHLSLFNPAAKRMVQADLMDIPPDQWSEKYHIYEADGETLLNAERLPLIRALHGEIVENEELVLIPNPGTRRHVICNARAMYVHSGEQIGAVVSMQDITDRVRIEAQYRQAQKMEAIGQLTGGMAHDFNNLLAIILGNLQLIQRQLTNDERFAHRAAAAVTAARRGAELTNRLLAFARKQTLEAKPININNLIQGLDEMLSRTLGEAISLKTVLHDSLWTVQADEMQLEMAILNLAINARDAMEQMTENNRKLIIETRNATIEPESIPSDSDLTPGDHVQISIVDTGHGMSEETKRKAFEPFFTTKGVGVGSGLGLSMVYGFIKQSGGHVRIDSEEGNGTTVTMYLPRTADPIKEERETDAPRPKISAGTERILVVEDNTAVRDVIVAMLKDLGYRTTEASGAEAALEILRSSDGHFDLLLTDVIMPGRLNGPELVKVVRKEFPEIGILFTSGFAAAGELEPAGNCGSSGFVRKPFRHDVLAMKVRNALRSSAKDADDRSESGGRKKTES